MNLNGENLKIALQRQGRLAEASRHLLRAAGVDFDYPDGRLFARAENFPLDILMLRDDDIPEYVQDGIADLGIVGLNVVREKVADVAQLEFLGFGQCTLALAVPEAGIVQSLQDLDGKRVATSYPRITRDFFEERRISARVVEISGSVEVSPGLDVADAICDLVSTGSTLRLHNLRPIEVVMQSEAVLVANRSSLGTERKQRLIESLRLRITSHLRARRTRYVMMNAPAEVTQQIRDILPGMKSPTVVPLAEEGMVAVHAAIPGDLFWEVVEKLKGAGATDLLVVPIESLVI